MLLRVSRLLYYTFFTTHIADLWRRSLQQKHFCLRLSPSLLHILYYTHIADLWRRSLQQKHFYSRLSTLEQLC